MAGQLWTIMYVLAGLSNLWRAEEAPGQDALKAKASLAENVVVKVVAARTTVPLETKGELLSKVPDGPHYYLTFGGTSIGGGPSVLLKHEGQADSKRVVGSGNVFVRRCTKLASPKGKYVEVLLSISNKGTADFRASLTEKDKRSLGIALSAQGATSKPDDFIGPGFSSSRPSHLKDLQDEGLTVVSEFKGDVGVFLEPQGRTWIWLLFDVPGEARSGQLAILNVAPFDVVWGQEQDKSHPTIEGEGWELKIKEVSMTDEFSLGQKMFARSGQLLLIIVFEMSGPNAGSLDLTHAKIKDIATGKDIKMEQIDMGVKGSSLRINPPSLVFGGSTVVYIASVPQKGRDYVFVFKGTEIPLLRLLKK